jgi:hypothetical protein
MTVRRFRAFVIAHVAAFLAAVFAGLLPEPHSATLSAAFDAEPFWMNDAPTLAVLPFVLLLMVAIVASIVGLYRFKPWGRSLALWSTAVATPLAVFAGPSLSSGLESALWEVSTLLWGAILALAYYSPVASQFRAGHPASPAAILRSP